MLTDMTPSVELQKGLWFAGPATSFLESSPIGNGRMGAMVFGKVHDERIVLNVLSLWSGSATENDRLDAHKALPEIRRLLFTGQNMAAEALVNQTFTCKGKGSGEANGAEIPYGCYQVLANIRVLGHGSDAPVSHYVRTLNMLDGVVDVSFDQANKQFTRTHFVSFPHQVMVIRVSGTAKIILERPENAVVRPLDNGDIRLDGQLPDGTGKGGMRFAAQIRTVTNQSETIFLIAADTDYKQSSLPPLEPILARAQQTGYHALRRAHMDDYKQLLGRVSLDLGPGRNDLPLPERIETAQRVPDAALCSLLFQFGRHLLISSSRPGGLPANLQGIWAGEIHTPWNGDYHLDINVQMNYWLAETTNLAPCHLPLLDFAASLVPNGSKTAKAYYNARGWVAHVISNVWGFTAPGESAVWGSTNNGGAWMCQHIWQRFLFNRDIKELKKYYPVMQGAAAFYVDFLTENPKGYLVTAPSNSPENAYRLPGGAVAHTCAGPVMDIQIVRELFTNTIHAGQLLGVDDTFINVLIAKLEKLPPHQIGKHGQLQEWQEDYDEVEVQHRHVSHLYGLFPGDQITPSRTPELALASRTTLERRGDDGTGWSLAWKVAFWARLQDGNRAHKLLQRFLRPVFDTDFNMTNGGGVYPNLFCAHPPFQADGNFGVAAGIAELLVQSHEVTSNAIQIVHLLPALPSQWADGYVSGLRVRGNAEVSITWTKGTITKAVITAIQKTEIAVKTHNLPLSSKKPSMSEKHLQTWKLRKGQKVVYGS